MEDIILTLGTAAGRMTVYKDLVLECGNPHFR